jgi:6-phosphogluconate dehydrogenase
MKIAISGLGRMGMQIARKLAEAGHEVIAHNRSSDKVDEAATYGAQKAYTKQEVVDAFKDEQAIVWIMVPADVIEAELKDWLSILPKGSILIDGGNTDYRKTAKHGELVHEQGSELIDSGTSGGVWGLERGFSLMVGGNEATFTILEPIFETLGQPNGGYQHFGPSGSGHYVKMVHNAIEYGMMESLAEGYRMLREGPYEAIDLGKAGDVWQKSSVVTSWLNELSRDALKENPTLEGIDGYVAESGEARWTIETAKELGIPLPAIEASFDVRLASQKGEVNFATKLLSAMRNKFGGHTLNK